MIVPDGVYLSACLQSVAMLLVMDLRGVMVRCMYQLCLFACRPVTDITDVNTRWITTSECGPVKIVHFIHLFIIM